MTVNNMEPVRQMMLPLQTELGLAAKKFGSIYQDILWRIRTKSLIHYIDSCPPLAMACKELMSDNSAEHLTTLFADWRLPLLTWLHQGENDPLIAKAINLLTWLQKNKTFFQDWISRNEKLYSWLNNNSLESIVLTNFTTTVYSLSKVTQSQQRLMDVNALWRSQVTSKLWGNHELSKCKKLLGTTYDNLPHTSIQSMLNTGASAIAVFLSTFTENHIPSSAEFDFNVYPDILRCLMLMHPDNKPLLDVLINARPALNDIIKSYKNTKLVSYLPNARARQDKRSFLLTSNHISRAQI